MKRKTQKLPFLIRKVRALLAKELINNMVKYIAYCRKSTDEKVGDLLMINNDYD
jgi:hypothetical protein